MTQLELAQQEYVHAAQLTRAAAEEHARARVELKVVGHSEDRERIEIASMRSTWATKLWETRLDEEARTLTSYNALLRQEVRKDQREERADQAEEGRHLCSLSPAIILSTTYQMSS